MAAEEALVSLTNLLSMVVVVAVVVVVVSVAAVGPVVVIARRSPTPLTVALPQPPSLP